MKLSIKWTTPPDVLVVGLKGYEARVYTAIRAVANYIAQKMQGEAFTSARWTDRTGNARSGLFGVAEAASKTLVNIYLAHTMSYGVFLELAHGQRYAIIMPTIQKNLPVIKNMLDEIFR